MRESKFTGYQWLPFYICTGERKNGMASILHLKRCS